MRRNATLDALRGYALVCIMLNHIPAGWARQFTLTNFAIYDAAELFVLLSGFLVGMVCVKVEERQGRQAAQLRFLKRAFQVWLALVVGAGGVLLGRTVLAPEPAAAPAAGLPSRPPKAPAIRAELPSTAAQDAPLPLTLSCRPSRRCSSGATCRCCTPTSTARR